MRRSLIGIALALLTPSLAAAQTIASQQLPDFRCILRISAGEDTLRVLGAGPEQWTVATPAWASSSGGYIDRGRGLCDFSYEEQLTPAAWVGTTGICVVPLQPHDSNQFQKHVLSLWRAAGDSMSLIAIADKGRVSDADEYRLLEPRACGADRYAVVTVSASADAGEEWGAVDIYLFDAERRRGVLAYSSTYSWESCAPSDTLLASWNDDEAATLRLVRQRLRPVPIAGIDGDCRTVMVNSDTTLVSMDSLARRQ